MLDWRDDLTVEELRLLNDDMNIFMLDHNPVAAARAHCDRHVLKMIIESAQLLSTAWHRLDNDYYMPLDKQRPTPWFEWIVPPALRGQPVFMGHKDGTVNSGDRSFWLLHGHRVYSPTHENHPSAIWTRQLGGNYRWLWRLALSLLDEYAFRYGRTHRSAPVVWALEPLPPSLLKTANKLTEVPLAMPDEYKVEVRGSYDAVASYRRYYREGKEALHQWTKRGPPEWI